MDGFKSSSKTGWIRTPGTLELSGRLVSSNICHYNTQTTVSSNLTTHIFLRYTSRRAVLLEALLSVPSLSSSIGLLVAYTLLILLFNLLTWITKTFIYTTDTQVFFSIYPSILILALLLTYTRCMHLKKSLHVFAVSLSRAIDGFAPSTDSAVPSIDPSMAQQSVDGAALSTHPIWCWSKSSHLFVVLRL